MPAATNPSKTISIRLPAETARRLQERATRENTTVNGIVSRLVNEHLSTPHEGETAYDLLKDFIGCCSSEGGPIGRNAEKEWGEYVVRKHQRSRG